MEFVFHVILKKKSVIGKAMQVCLISSVRRAASGPKLPHLCLVHLQRSLLTKGQQVKHPLTLICQHLLCAASYTQCEPSEVRNTPQGGAVSTAGRPGCFYEFFF